MADPVNQALIHNALTDKDEAIPKEALGRAQESEGARELTAPEIKKAQKVTKDAGSFDPVETNLAALHANLRGSLGAIGVPLDEYATDVAGFVGGDGAKKSTRDYLNELDEKHPYATAWSGLLGTVGGTVAGAEMMGAPGAVSKPAAAGLKGFAQRTAMAGAENVLQANTKDLNEGALGDHAVNGSKLVAAAPGRFLLGAALGAGAEGIFAGAGAAYRGIAKRATPALEAGVDSALGAEVGDASAGARVRALSRQHGGVEVPRTREELESILTKEQGVQQGAAQAAHQEGLGMLAESQGVEGAELAASHEARRAGVLAEGAAGVEGAERAGAESQLEAMAKGGAGVEEAELAGAAARKAAGGDAFEANLASSKLYGGAGEALHEEVAGAGKAVNDIAEHYSAMRAPLEEELQTAKQIADKIASERAANAHELGEALEAQSNAASNKLTPEQFDEMVDTYLGVTGHRGDPNARWSAEEFMRHHYGDDLTENVADTAAASHIERLKSLGDQLETAHKNALEHMGSVESSIRGVEKEGAAKTSEFGKIADARVTKFQKIHADKIEKASKAAEASLENLRSVQESTHAAVEAARAIGVKQAAAAEKKAFTAVQTARAQADASHAAFEKLAGKEKESLAKLHDTQVRQVAPPSAATDVDPLLEGMKSPTVVKQPLISGGAAWGAGASLLHGNPVAAGAALASSFAAGRLRGINNLVRARMLRSVSEQITKVDTAVRDGAALILGRSVGKAATDTVDNVERHDDTKAGGASFDKVSKEMLAMQANPDLLERNVRASLGEMSDHAPQTYAGALLTTQRAHAFLLGALPQAQVDPHSLTPQLDRGTISETEKYDFMRSFGTINDPLSIFKDVHAGDVTEQQVDAIRRVYPPLYDQIRSEVDSQRASLTHDVDYERAIHVGTLLGILTDQVLEPDFQNLQAASYADKTAAAAPDGASPKPMASSKLAKSMQSASETVESGDP